MTLYDIDKTQPVCVHLVLTKALLPCSPGSGWDRHKFKALLCHLLAFLLCTHSWTSLGLDLLICPVG